MSSSVRRLPTRSLPNLFMHSCFMHQLDPSTPSRQELGQEKLSLPSWIQWHRATDYRINKAVFNRKSSQEGMQASGQSLSGNTDGIFSHPKIGRYWQTLRIIWPFWWIVGTRAGWLVGKSPDNLPYPKEDFLLEGQCKDGSVTASASPGSKMGKLHKEHTVWPRK